MLTQMVDARSIIDEADAIPNLFREALGSYSDIETADEADWETILRHASSHIRDAYSMLKTLHLFSLDPSEENRRDMKAISEDLNDTMNAMARYAILNEFII